MERNQPDAGRLHGGIGRVRLVAKGARSKRSTLKGAFNLSPLSCFASVGVVKSKHCECRSCLAGAAIKRYHPLQRFYINELLSRVLEYETRFSELFSITYIAFSLWPVPLVRQNPPAPL